MSATNAGITKDGGHLKRVTSIPMGNLWNPSNDDPI